MPPNTPASRVEGGLLPDGLPFAPASFDLVCAFDVIEHVDEDAASVAALARLLKPGGYLATTVPGQPWMWSRHDEAAPPQAPLSPGRLPAPVRGRRPRR